MLLVSIVDILLYEPTRKISEHVIARIIFIVVYSILATMAAQYSVSFYS